MFKKNNKKALKAQEKFISANFKEENIKLTRLEIYISLAIIILLLLPPIIRAIILIFSINWSNIYFILNNFIYVITILIFLAIILIYLHEQLHKIILGFRNSFQIRLTRTFSSISYSKYKFILALIFPLIVSLIIDCCIFLLKFKYTSMYFDLIIFLSLINTIGSTGDLQTSMYIIKYCDKTNLYATSINSETFLIK